MSIIRELNKRYSVLAETSENLSCGHALTYLKLRQGDICVDLGCGKGNDVIKLSGLVGESGFVYGIDATEKMISIAKERSNLSDLKNVNFILSSFENTSLASDSADVLLSNCALNHAANKQAVWNEIFRILKHHGYFIVSDIYAKNTIPEKYSSNPELIADCWAGAVTKEIYLKQISEAGFKNITILNESKPYKRGFAEIISFTIKGEK